MKKAFVFILVLVTIIFLMYLCKISPDTKITDESNHLVSNQNTADNLSTTVADIKFECLDHNENYVRILSDTMVLDTAILNEVIKVMKITVSPVYFNMKSLPGRGEEFAIAVNGKATVYENPPHNKQEVEINNENLKIISEISSCELITNKNTYNINEVEAYLTLIREATDVYLNSDQFKNNSKINANRLKLKQKLSIAQTKAFPKLRKAYYLALKEMLWPENVEVQFNDKSITLIGGIYANNKNKQDSYNAMRDKLEQLRFKRVNFKWYKYDDEYTYWTINSPSDATIQ